MGRNMEELSAGNNAALEAILARIIFELQEKGILNDRILAHPRSQQESVGLNTSPDFLTGYDTTFSRITLAVLKHRHDLRGPN